MSKDFQKWFLLSKAFASIAQCVSFLKYDWTHKQISGQVFCQTCDKNISAKNFGRHLKDVHASAREAVTCPYCSKIYKNRNSLQVHIKHQHNVQNLHWNKSKMKKSCFPIWWLQILPIVFALHSCKNPISKIILQARNSAQRVCDGITSQVWSATNKSSILAKVST